MQDVESQDNSKNIGGPGTIKFRRKRRKTTSSQANMTMHWCSAAVVGLVVAVVDGKLSCSNLSANVRGLANLKDASCGLRCQDAGA